MTTGPTKKQKAIIHIAANELGLDRDDYENLLEAEFGVRSSSDLTAAQADALIRRLYRSNSARHGAGRPKRAVKLERPDAPADPGGPVTPEQQRVIDGLRDALAIKPDGLRKVSMRVTKQPWPQTQSAGQKLIYALVSLGARDLLNYVENLSLPRSPVTPWERGFLFDNEHNARSELRRVAEARGKRGARSMPRLSLTKLLEIINKYRVRVTL